MISEPLVKKSAHVVEKLLDEMLPRPQEDWPNLPANWCQVKTRKTGDLTVWAAHTYAGPVKELIQALKFQGRTDLLACFDWCGLTLPDKPLFVPVPQSRGGFVVRGYNQSELLAQQLGLRYSASMVDLLCRFGVARPQHFNPLSQRLARENSFRLRQGVIYDPSHDYVLVDDVVTSGATLAECAAVLRSAGLKVSVAAVIAATPKKARLTKMTRR